MFKFSFKFVALTVTVVVTGCSNGSSGESANTPIRELAGSNNRFNLTFEPGIIAAQCRSKKESLKSEVGGLLDRLQREYATKEARIKNPEKFVASIDFIISKTRLAPILMCRDQLNATAGFSYALKFQDPKLGNLSMQVTTEEENNSTGRTFKKTLEFNLIKSVQKVIFVYLHELTHICQAPEFERIYTSYEADPKNTERIGDVYRQRILGEIEAFYTMNIAYTELVKFSSKLCEEEQIQSSQPSISEGYIQSEEALINGSFAQTIIFGYKETFKGHEEYILDLNSPLRDYKTTQLPEGKFLLNGLNRKLKAGIDKLGILVAE